MICAACWKKITAETKQTYKWGMHLPYCKNCIESYIMKQKLNAMNPEQRVDFIRQTKKELLTKIYTPEDIEDSKKKMKAIGLKEKEIQLLFQGIE